MVFNNGMTYSGTDEELIRFLTGLARYYPDGYVPYPRLGHRSAFARLARDGRIDSSMRWTVRGDRIVHYRPVDA